MNKNSVQKIGTHEVERLVRADRFKTQHAYSVARVLAALLGDCSLVTFKACLAGYIHTEEFLTLPIEAKAEIRQVLEWR